MTKSIQDIFLETKTIFESQAKVAVQEALDKIYEDYLPHVENDNYFNTRQYARHWILRMMSDGLRQDDIQLWEITKEYDAKDIRQKMFQDNKEELTELIGKDIMERLKVLEERYTNDWERRYE